MPSVIQVVGICIVLGLFGLTVALLYNYFLSSARRERERMDEIEDKAREKRRKKTMKTLKTDEDGAVSGTLIGAVLAVLVVVGIGFYATGLNNVSSGERTVVFHSNGSLEVLPEGMYQFRNPITTDVFTYNVQRQLYSDRADGMTMDLQLAKTEVSVLFHPSESQIGWIHQNFGTDYASRIIPPSVQDAVKSAVSYWKAEDLTGNTREVVKQDIIRRITQDLVAQNLVVDQISLTDFDFSAEFNKAAEERNLATQKAIEAKNKLEQTKYEANATIVRAQAEAESARIISEQIEQNPQYVEYLYAQAFAAHWNGQLPVYSGGDSGAILNLGSGNPFRSG